MTTSAPTIIYLHGFLSSPNSPSSIETAEYFRLHAPHLHLIQPQLPSDLQTAKKRITDLVRTHQHCHFMGRSLGGLLASWARENFGGKAVLINPLVNPEKVKSQFIGWHESRYTGERFFVDEAAFAALQALEPSVIDAERYWVLLQTGDEVLNYEIAAHRYQQSKLTVEAGGDHVFSQLTRWLPAIVRFLEVYP